MGMLDRLFGKGRAKRRAAQRAGAISQIGRPDRSGHAKGQDEQRVSQYGREAELEGKRQLRQKPPHAGLYDDTPR